MPRRPYACPRDCTLAASTEELYSDFSPPGFNYLEQAPVLKHPWPPDAVLIQIICGGNTAVNVSWIRKRGHWLMAWAETSQVQPVAYVWKDNGGACGGPTSAEIVHAWLDPTRYVYNLRIRCSMRTECKNSSSLDREHWEPVTVLYKRRCMSLSLLALHKCSAENIPMTATGVRSIQLALAMWRY